MPGNLCEHCSGVCCRYVALPIETPTTPADFDDVRWYLLHENISVFLEDGDWYISMATPCRHLQPDHRCGIYATRPRICRRYTTENCDYHSGDYGWDEHFTCPEHLDEYLAAPRRRPGKNGRKSQDGKKTQQGWPGMQPTHSQKSKQSKKPRTQSSRRLRGARLIAARTDIAGAPLPTLGTTP